MTTSIDWGIPATPFMLYDGTNSADIISFVNSHRPEYTASIVSESAGVLEIELNPNDPESYPVTPYTINSGERFSPVTGQQVDGSTWTTTYVKV